MNFTSNFTLAALVCINFLSAYIPWSAIFLFTQKLFGIRLYYLKDRDQCERIQQKIQHWCSHTTDKGKGYGYSMGKWFLVSVSIHNGFQGEEDKFTVHLIATEESFKKLVQLEAVGETKKLPSAFENLSTQTKKVTICERCGSFANPWFRKRIRELNLIAVKEQQDIVDEIKLHFQKHRYCVAYIHGPPQTGKSMVGLLLASELEGVFCNTLKPWQPGESLGMLYTDVEPKQNKALIIVFDEFDSTLMRIHENAIQPHKHIPVSIMDKSGWNHTLDEIQRGMYQDVILILTSNKSPEFINALDTSYIREGRVDKIFSMDKIIQRTFI